MQHDQSGGGRLHRRQDFAWTEVAGQHGAYSGAERIAGPGGLQIRRQHYDRWCVFAGRQCDQVFGRLVVMRLYRGKHHIGLMPIDGGAQAGKAGRAHDFDARTLRPHRLEACSHDRGRRRDQQTNHAASATGRAHDFDARTLRPHRLEACSHDRGRRRDQQTNHAASATGRARRIVTSRVAARSPRRNCRWITPPVSSSASCRSSTARNGRPPTPMSTSPVQSGAAAAALPGSTLSTSRPKRRSSKRTGCTVTPNENPDAPRRKNAVTALPGTAAPSPCTIMVLMPITRPYASASGPPELPGARRTSASTQLWRPNPARLPSACTTPVVTAPMKPMGLPMAITNSPTRSAPESPKVAAGRPPASTLSVARSRRASRASKVAGNSWPSQSRIEAPAPRATCALVTIWPSGEAITPEPPELAQTLPPRRRTSTVERRKRSAISPKARAMSVFPPGPFSHRYT